MDTSLFDAKIDDKNKAITAIQTDLDNDPDQIKLKALQKKADDIRALVSEKTDAENKKAQFVAIQTQIDTKTQEIADLNKQLEDIKASIK